VHTDLILCTHGATLERRTIDAVVVVVVVVWAMRW